MTNLSSKRKKNRILTPENSVLVIPIFTAIIISIILTLSVFTPLLYRLKETNSEIKILEEKISYIPIYKNYILKMSDVKNIANDQQKRIINIISDPNQLETILSEINQLTLVNNLRILQIEPKPKVKFSQNLNSNPPTNKKSKKKKRKSKNNVRPINSRDNLLLPSLEKHIFQVSIVGEYNNLLLFLQQMEFLQPIAITENIDMQSIGTKQQSDSSEIEEEMIKLSFNLSTYAQITN